MQATSIFSNSQDERPNCRICLSDTQPLYKLPCNCKGSLANVHQNCLTDLITSRTLEEVTAKGSFQCEICKKIVQVESYYAFNWLKLKKIKIEIYFIIFGIVCLLAFGVHIAKILTLMSKKEEQGVIEYLIAYLWIIGVILYVLFEPIFSELKQYKFKLKIWKQI